MVLCLLYSVLLKLLKFFWVEKSEETMEKTLCKEKGGQRKTVSKVS